MTAMVPADRLRNANHAAVDPAGRYVLYWMLANRRPWWNHALEHAVLEAKRLGKPLVVVESMRTGFTWATLRFHRFAIQGMADNAAAFAGRPLTYLPHVEDQPGEVARLIRRLAQHAALVVADAYPCFLLPEMVEVLATASPVACTVVDGCGLLPLAAGKACERAVDFRRMLQRELKPHLGSFPVEDPLRGIDLPRLDGPLDLGGLRPSDPATLLAGGITRLAIDQQVRPSPLTGGWRAAQACLRGFLADRLPRYADERSEVEADAASGLSPWLHAGHLSVHEVMASLWARDGWTPDRLAEKATGSKDGWWGLPPDSEAFVDELVTWRELGYHFCHHRPGFDTWESLPAWARRTLDDHAMDPREHRYSPDQFARGETHDPLWNAAQRQLVTEGRMPNYLRMLWGKKVIEWTSHPREALELLIELNNRYALDGCNPNSYTGIAWCFGRFDRPWAPIRPIFGSIRWMSSANTMRKQKLTAYIERWTSGRPQTLLD